MKYVRSVLVALLAACACLSPPVHADDKVPILEGKDVTRDKLLGNLAPPETPASEDLERGGPIGYPTPQRSNSVGLLFTFVVNSAKLNGSAKSTLDILAEVLHNDRLKNKRIVIEGHADPTGNSNLNMMLSQARAESVVEYLATRGNVRRDLLKAEGKGSGDLYNKEVPSAAENRRVVVVVLP